MSTIIAIGGGEIASEETFVIDEYIVKYANKKKPNFLFIPTASHESEGYIKTVEKIYKTRLGCDYDWLSLINNSNAINDIKTKISWADIIYVGGGDTTYMMSLWQKFGLDKELHANYLNDKIYSGLSAGSICWFDKGIGDPEIDINSKNCSYSLIDGLGLIPLFHCPHYDERILEPFFNNAMNTVTKDTIAIENNCAIVVNNKSYELIKSKDDKNAYRLIYNQNGSIEKKLMDQKGTL